MSLILRPFNFDTLFPTTLFDEICKSFDYDTAVKKVSQGFPKYDQYEENGNTVIEMALAGYSKDQLLVQVEGNKLIISANKSEKSDPNERRIIARRSFTKDFTDTSRVWNLDASQVSFVNGLLKIVIPPNKTEKEVKKVLEIK